MKRITTAVLAIVLLAAGCGFRDGNGTPDDNNNIRIVPNAEDQPVMADIDWIESTITRQMSRQTGIASFSFDVNCPPDVEAEAGREFTCILTDNRPGVWQKKHGIQVTLDDDLGNRFTWVAVN